MNLAARLGHGRPVPLPRNAFRAREATRGVEVPMEGWDRWNWIARKREREGAAPPSGR
jgi:hypothetical protein